VTRTVTSGEQLPTKGDEEPQDLQAPQDQRLHTELGSNQRLELQNEALRISERQAQAALARYTTLFTHLPMAGLVVDSYGLILEVNPRARALLALRDIRSHQYFVVRLIHQQDRSAVMAAFQRAKTSGAEALSEVHFGAADGSRFQADLHIAALPREEQTPARFICAVVDQTEVIRQRHALARAYDDLERSEERYRVLADYSPDWDYWCGTDGQFVYVSPACLDVTGYTSEAFRTNPHLFHDILHEDDLPIWQAHLAATHAGTHKDTDQVQFRIRARDGQIRWIEHVCRPVRTADGRCLGRRGVNRDITDRHAAREALRESECRYRALYESAAEGMAIIQHGVFTSVNRAALTMLGYADAAAVINRRPEELSPPQQADGESSAEKANRILALATTGQVQRFDWEHLRADGTTLVVRVTLIPVKLKGGNAAFAIWYDLSERRAAELRDERARTLFENSSEGIILTDPEQRIVAVNRAFTEITGYSESEALGQTPRILQSGRQDADFYRAMWASLERTGEWRGQFWNRRKNGEIYPQLSTITAVRDVSGQLSSYIAVFGDITHLKRSEQALYDLAHKDPLTGLANRTLLRARLERSLHRSAHERQMLGLLFLDLDLFKNVNDTLGHPVGDALLQSVATAMAQRVRNSDNIARLGGDEFVVLVEGMQDPDVAARLARRLLAIFTRPFAVQGRELHITASIGISVFPRDGEDMDALLANADVAMYQAKEQGRNTYRFFKPEMAAGAGERLQLENALRGALARDELTLEYQPQVCLDDGRMRGVEALLRWHHPTLGKIPPARFIPIAEELGIICEFGSWTLDQACRQLANWDHQGFPVARLAVNLSVRQLERPNLVSEIVKMLELNGVDPHRLELEVTESMLMRRTEQVIASLTALRKMGITIAVDDFGSGFSSLAYLKRLPIQRLKIDKSFVDQLTVDANDDAIARAIIALGRGLGLEVIAEGVDTEAQAEFLRREGCTEAQGFLFGRPVTADKLMQGPYARDATAEARRNPS
jgi:diguanylate cyclase (GGDEF)-like protein/PAS domain S-box-containing protein